MDAARDRPNGPAGEGSSSRWGARVLIAIVVVAVHLQVIGFGLTFLDDGTLLAPRVEDASNDTGWLAAFHEEIFRTVEPGERFYYRPLLAVTFDLDRFLATGDPGAAHATNLVLHLVATLLVHHLLLVFGGAPASALAIALVFGVHPAFASVTAWIPGRNESLLAIVAIPSFLAWRRFRSTGRAILLAGHLVFLAAALLTKENAAVLPVVCLAHDRLVGRAVSRRGRLAAAIAGWAGVVGLYVALRRHALGAFAPVAASDLLSHAATRASAFLRYLGHAFLPVDLAVYPTGGGPAVAVGTVVVGALVLAAVRLRGGVARWIAFGTVWFGLWLAPSVAIPMGSAKQAFFDARMYLPCVGLAIVFARVVPTPERGRRAILARAATVAILAALAVGTMAHARDYGDRTSFWSAAARSAPASPFVRALQGEALWDDGRNDEAIAAWEAGLRGDPANRWGIVERLDAAYGGLGVSAERRKALEREVASNPKNAAAWYWLGVQASFSGDDDVAVHAWRRAIDADPSDARAYAQLVLSRRAAGDEDGAARWRRLAAARGLALPPALAGDRDAR